MNPRSEEAMPATLEPLSDEMLCDLVNAYWRKRGFEARARVEKRSYTVPRRTIGKTDFPEMKFDRREIVSDLVNAKPPTAKAAA
jgi:hypothetical protein